MVIDVINREKMAKMETNVSWIKSSMVELKEHNKNLYDKMDTFIQICATKEELSAVEKQSQNDLDNFKDTLKEENNTKTTWYQTLLNNVIPLANFAFIIVLAYMNFSK